MSDEQPTIDQPTKEGFDPKIIKTTYADLEAAGAKSKSQIIRYLSSLGYERSAIAKFLNVKYQHVRNVLAQPLKRQIKAEREAARLKGQHPSTLTERQKLIVAGALEVTPEAPKVSDPMFSDRRDPDDEEGWVSSFIKPEEVGSKKSGKYSQPHRRRR